MRRSIARGRLVPQSLSTDPRLGRLSLKAALLFPLMWVNCDDQGRISGDPDEIKYTACPNIDHITRSEVPKLVKELEQHGFLKSYNSSGIPAIQMLDWWREQRLQWAWPSFYPAPPGWQDRLRYKPNPKEIVTDNWLPPSLLASILPGSPPGHQLPLKPLPEIEIEKEDEEEDERGNIPGAPGGSTASSVALNSEIILQRLTSCFKRDWGRVPAENPEKIIPRKPDARESAQLRDMAREISAAGGCPLEYIDQAFMEAAGQNKMHLSYARAIIFDWLCIERK